MAINHLQFKPESIHPLLLQLSFWCGLHADVESFRHHRHLQWHHAANTKVFFVFDTSLVAVHLPIDRYSFSRIYVERIFDVAVLV